MNQPHDDFASAFEGDDTAASAATADQGAEHEPIDQGAPAGTADEGDTPQGNLTDDKADEATDQHDDDQDAAQQGSQPEATTPPATDWETEAKRWKDRYSTLQGKYNAEVARAQRGNDGPAGDQSAAPKQATQAPQPQPAAASDDDDEQLLQELDEQLPTVAKAVRKLIAKERQAIEQDVMGRIAPIERTAQESARERHFNTIRSAHQDFDVVVTSPDLAAWVDEQPPYLAASYRAVMERGTAEDVVDLLARFKKESGYAPAPAPQSNPAPKARTDALRSAAAPRLRSHAAIPSRVDRNDFDAAWAD